MPQHTNEDLNGATSLVAIVRAARAIGDRDLERAARQELLERYGMRIVFERPRREVAHAR